MFEETFQNHTNEALQKAETYFHEAYRLQTQGDYPRALEWYQKSIEAFPTAEAHTFRGWVYSAMGDLKRAIAECETAIRVDPSFGNPYNDIGAYLITLKKPAEAVPWLKKALEAPRYDARHYPHFNLGRVCEAEGSWDEALAHYHSALSLQPTYQTAREAVARIRSLMLRCN